MCDQTEVIYSPGDVVWVKLGPVWWPAQVFDYDKLPEEVISSLKKKPIAVVKFFQEDSYEYVKNLNSIYHYSCRRKHEFIKKGLDMCRSNNRDVPSNMKMFPSDIVTAEHLTNGNMNILDEREFAPQEKEDYSELFGKRSPKKAKSDSKKDVSSTLRIKALTESTLKNGRRTVATPTIPRPITHPRFINKALKGQSDHEIRIRQQSSVGGEDSDCPKQYNCHLCGFSSSRINVIVYHNKSHNAGYADAYLPTQQHPQQSAKGRKIKSERKVTYVAEKRPRTSDSLLSQEPPAKKKSIKSTSPDKNEGGSREEMPEKVIFTGVTTNTTTTTTTTTPTATVAVLKKPIFGKKKSAKDKAEKLAKEKQQSDAFRETLLKDWDDEGENDDNDENDGDSNTEDKADTSKESISSITEDLTASINTSEVQKEGYAKKQKETSCFDFDDSEDGLNIDETLKFGQKIPRVLTEKPKKHAVTDMSSLKSEVQKKDSKSEESESGDLISCNEVSLISLSETMDENKSNEAKEKEVQYFDEAVKSLLDETSVPNIPDTPSHFEIKKKICELVEHMEEVDGSEVDDGGGVISDNVVVDKTEECEQLIEPMTVDAHTDELVERNNVSIVHSVDSRKNDMAEHFLVKTSEEVATSSSDNSPLEGKFSTSGNNVASLLNNFDSSSNASDVPENVKESCEEANVKLNSCPHLHKELDILEKGSGSQSASDVCQVSAQPTVSEHSLISSFTLSDEISTVGNQVNIGEIKKEEVEIKDIKAECLGNTLQQDGALLQQSSVGNIGLKEEEKPVVLKQEDSFQEMDFDINSMPVIIGDDMVAQKECIVTESLVHTNSFSPNLIGVRTEASPIVVDKMINTKQGAKQISNEQHVSNVEKSVVFKNEVNSGSYSTAGRIITKDGKLSTTSRKVLLSPNKAVTSAHAPQLTTIKVQPNISSSGRLAVPGLINQKNVSSSNQVLILKSASPSGQHSKSIVQQGGKVLILSSPQGGSGQAKLFTTQKGLASGKLTGTRIITTKGTVLTTPTLVTQQPVLNKSGLVTGSTTKGTMLVNTLGTTQPPMLNRPNILSNSSKTVTTKSGQKILINKAGVITQSLKSVVLNKNNILTSASATASSKSITSQNILPKDDATSSQITVSGKGLNAVLKSSSISTSKGIILTPVASKGASVSSQKLRLITSNSASSIATANSGTKLLIQGSQSRVILPSSSLPKQQLKLVSGLKGQANTSTILIQTSPGVLTTSLPTSQVEAKNKNISMSLPTVISTTPVCTKSTIQVSQAQSQNRQAILPTQNKLVVQKVKTPTANILQKTPRKPVQRSAKKSTTDRLISASVPVSQTIQTVTTPVTGSSLPTASSQDTIILPSAGSLPVIQSSGVIQGSHLDASNQAAVVYLAVDESGNYRPIETTSVVNYEGAPESQQTLYIDPGTSDLENIFLAIDNAGNVVNITQPVQTTFTTENSVPPPSQDILAKALANTQVLQQETVATDNIAVTCSVDSSMLGCMFVESQTQYPQPSLSHSVLETSLTLNQPIMTPLEVPSAVSPRSLDQISTLQTGFLTDTHLLTTIQNKEKKTAVHHPSMPLLTEDTSSSTRTVDKNVFIPQVGTSSSMLTTATSDCSQITFQLALDENIVSSASEISSLGVISGTNLSQNTLTYIPSNKPQNVLDISNKNLLINDTTSSHTIYTTLSDSGRTTVNESIDCNEQQQSATPLLYESKSIVEQHSGSKDDTTCSVDKTVAKEIVSTSVSNSVQDTVENICKSEVCVTSGELVDNKVLATHSSQSLNNQFIVTESVPSTVPAGGGDNITTSEIKTETEELPVKSDGYCEDREFNDQGVKNINEDNIECYKRRLESFISEEQLNVCSELKSEESKAEKR